MKCKDCRKQPEHLTLWDKFRRFVLFKVFAEDLTDLFSDKYTQGFSDGFKEGSTSTMDIWNKNFNKLLNK